MTRTDVSKNWKSRYLSGTSAGASELKQRKQPLASTRVNHLHARKSFQCVAFMAKTKPNSRESKPQKIIHHNSDFWH